jgi:phosphatidate cytidylyltransferase
VLSSLLLVTVPGFALGATFMAIANRRVSPGVARARWLKIAIFFVIVHLVLGVAMLGRPWVTLLVAAILAAGTLELLCAWRRMPQPRSRRVWPVFGAVAVASLWSSWLLPAGVFALLFLVTAASDGFSQVVGQWLGRRPLAPRISPAKTVEGLLGGLAAALVVAVLARRTLIDEASLTETAFLALSMAFAGLVGDLSASWAKRRAGIKDYSAALPGQGGFLDRFDSLLGALTIVGPAMLVLDP